MQMAQNGIHHIGSTVTLRKDTIAALSLQRNAQPLKKSNYVRIVKRTQTAVEKSSISHNVFDDVRNLVGACDVAAPLARNHHLAPDAPHLFEEQDAPAALRRRRCRHHARRPRAHHDDPLHSLIPPQSSEAPRSPLPSSACMHRRQDHAASAAQNERAGAP